MNLYELYKTFEGLDEIKPWCRTEKHKRDLKLP